MINWQTVTLEDCTKLNGLFTDGDWIESKDQDSNGSVRLIQMADVGVGEYKNKSSRFLTNDKFVELKCTEVLPGDLLVSRMPAPIGRSCIFPGDEKKCATVVDIAILRVNSDVCYHKYLNYLMNTKRVRIQIEKKATGTTRKRISGKNLKNISIPLPPLETQHRIVDLLDRAQALIDKRKEQIALMDTLTQSLFYDMFGDPVKNPKGWEVRKLKELLLSVTNGLTRRRKIEENIGQVVLRLRDIKVCNIDYSDLNRIPLEDKEQAKFLALKNDLLFIRVNGNPEYVGRCAVFKGFKEPVYFNDHIMRVRLNKVINPNFIAFLLNQKYGKREIKRYRKTSAGQHTIAQSGLEKIELYLPPIELQNTFAERVQQIEAEKEKMVAALKEMEDNFNSIMQRAFRGELDI